MKREAKPDPDLTLPVWAPRPQAIPSFWHRWERADFGWGPLSADSGETTPAPEKVCAKAYLMIQADPLSVDQVLEEVRSLKGVTEGHEATGPFDIVAIIDADGTTDLPSLLCRATFSIQGVYAAAVVASESPPRYQDSAPDG